MKKIFFVLHAETYYNTFNRIQGLCNVPLNTHGIIQCSDFTIPTIPIDAAYHCGLDCSSETLHRILQANHIKIPIHESSYLLERSYGIFETLTLSQIQATYPILYSNWQLNDDIDIQGADKVSHVVDNIKKFLQEVKDSDTNTTLAVTHSGWMYIFYKWIHKMNVSDQIKFKILPLTIFELTCTFDDAGNMEYTFAMNGSEFIDQQKIL